MFIQLAEGVEEGAPPGRGDYSRWTADAIKDDELAAETSAIEERPHRDAVESRTAVVDAIRGRYAPLHSGATGAWRGGCWCEDASCEGASLHEDEQEAVGHRRDDEEIGRHDPADVILQERAPGLGWWMASAPCCSHPSAGGAPYAQPSTMTLSARMRGIE
jgi:hypothetical protein